MQHFYHLIGVSSLQFTDQLAVYFLVFSSSEVSCTSLSQDNSKQILHHLIPSSPDDGILLRYREITIRLYTGIPEIGTPLYLIIYIPISPSCHMGGVKQEDVANGFCLCYTSISGGKITSIAQRQSDEFRECLLNNSLLRHWTFHSDYKSLFIFGNEACPQSDELHSNFVKHSGKLVFDKIGTCYSILHKKFGIVSSGVPRNYGANDLNEKINITSMQDNYDLRAVG